VNWLDVAVVAAIVAGVYAGRKRGAVWVLLSLLGLLVGMVVGSLLAPWLAHKVSGDRFSQSLVDAGVFLFTVSLFQGIGASLGLMARVASLRRHNAWSSLDTAGGAALAGVGVVLASWYLGITFAKSNFTGLAHNIQRSAILSNLIDIAPQPPGWLSGVSNLLRPIAGANAFAGIEPDAAPVPLPSSINTPGVQTAANTVSKVISQGCGGLEVGSSWPIGNDQMVTNAHVVAGGGSTTVIRPDGRRFAADVVFFDPDTDVAVLHATGIGFTALPMGDGTPERGVTGAVIGYPDGGPEQSVPGALSGTIQARGYDIYSSSTVVRQIEVLSARVIPGNSGGPFIGLDGRVQGLVFAKSTSQDDVGYALTLDQISADLTRARQSHSAVNTGPCISG
jgi:S1-C subfamily serine protease